MITGLAMGRVSGLPMPVKIIAGLLGACGILGLAYIIFEGNSTALIVIGVGLAAVVGLLFLYKGILGWHRKRKANPLSQGLAGNAAAAPQGISEPARRARLDDLRRNFEQGVEKFRAAGKNLYSVPWYVLVGEPGSGKTEAIRHCNVGFPPGLQDQLQGAGGTLNMNWWFTNQAIILDTAGRLMFEEVVPGTTNEWAEFLKLLKNLRPNCPINGMLLVIPVDTLIKDSADQIEKKATKIAQQFEQIQRTLGVRFPVFVIITKCDLLNGFREFFDDLNDPQLQHQIMGWSNPAALDERFDPAAVTTHLETVKQRLIDRREHLLLDPVNTEDPQARRVDQVDALYALPDSIINIGPRLKRYLEMIFVAGEWSPKPLFLRGIYFTSSMTEGSALDAELAQVLGVPVDSLPEGRVWRRDRAYFLRDLFIEKVFREKGLITRATNAAKQQRTRQTIILSVGFLAVVILFLLTWLGSHQLENSIGGHRKFWKAAADFDPTSMQIIRKNRYNDDPYIKVGTKDANVADFFGSNLELMRAHMEIPLLFKPMAFLTGDIDIKRHEAYRRLFESTVLYPAFETARKKITEANSAAPGEGSGVSWSQAATDALAQLVKLEFAAAGNPPLKGDSRPRVDLDPLFRFDLSAEDYAKYRAGGAAKLQDVVDWTYSDQAHGATAWPPSALSPGTPESLAVIDQGVASTIAYWKRQTSDSGENLSNIAKMRQALTDFRATEDELIALKTRPIDKIELYNDFHERWQAGLARLLDARNRAVSTWAIVTKGQSDNATFPSIYQAEVERVAAEARKACDNILQYAPDPPANADPAKLNSSQAKLRDVRATLTDFEKQLDLWNTGPDAKKTLAEIAALDAALLASVKGNDNNLHHRFEVQAQLYELADKFTVKKDARFPLNGTVDDAFTQTDHDYSDAIDQIKRPLMQASQEDRLGQAGALAQFVIDTSARAKKYLIAIAALGALPDKPEAWPAFIANRAQASHEDLLRPPVPLVSFPAKTFDPAFAPQSAGGAAQTLDTLRKTTAANDATARILDAGSLGTRTAAIRKGFDGYRDSYIQYWSETAKDEIRFSFKNFKEFGEALINVTEPGITENLRAYRDKMVAALGQVNATDEASAIKAVPLPLKEECKTVLLSWSNLGDDSGRARRTVLALDATDFREQYSVASARNSDSAPALFWQRLPLQALSVLARDGRAEIDAGLTELARFERFPLAPPADPKDDLSLQDILGARNALEKVRGAAASAAGPAAVLSHIIAQGGTTRDPEIDKILVTLRGTDLLKNKQDYFNKLDKFFVALPSDNKPLSVTLSVMKDKLKEGTSIAPRFPYMVISQSGKSLREAALSSPSVDNCAVQYPGGDLLLQFREVPNGEFKHSETLSGPWAVLRILKSPNTHNVTRDGNKWSFEYLVTDSNKKTWSLWLQLEFSQPLPDLKDWPLPPSAPAQ